MNSFENEYVSWQAKCMQEISDKPNIILSAPTGSGKTRVALDWACICAGMVDKELDKKIYITSPIKALSNQRYRELVEAGFKVGLKTGDIEIMPEDAQIICCTQEIYTIKYILDENAVLIIDEFHYISDNKDRARVYIDALHDSKAKNIMLCSATFGNIDKLKQYVDKLSSRDFYVYESKERLTKLNFEEEIKKRAIKNAIVFAFSRSRCEYIAKEIEAGRENIPDERYNKILEIAKKYDIKESFESGDNSEDTVYVPSTIKKGVGAYYGTLLPKQKLFLEEIFEQKLIDVLVGTDALALGVNLPAEMVVLTQLVKYNGGENKRISKNLFDQLVGRAGRRGYYDEGYVYYFRDFNSYSS